MFQYDTPVFCRVTVLENGAGILSGLGPYRIFDGGPGTSHRKGRVFSGHSRSSRPARLQLLEDIRVPLSRAPPQRPCALGIETRPSSSPGLHLRLPTTLLFDTAHPQHAL